ncbi:hypothetical protein LCGC14_2743260, partial [marine sediment metagenome]
MLEGNTGEHEGTLKELDVPAIENEELVDSVEARLANLRDITDGTRKSKLADDQKELDDPTPDDKEDAKDDDQADDQAKADPTPDDKTGDRDGDKEDDVELSDAFLRAAIHRGWKEEDAKAYHEKDPEAADSLFQNLLIDVNKTSSEWAAIGKAKLEAERKAAEVPV